MSDQNIVVNSEGSDHDELIGEEVEALHAEMTSMHSDLSLTAEHRDDGEEITAAALSLTAEHRDDGEEITAAALEGASVQAAVRINVYENIPFAGGDGDYSILSVLFGPHSIGEGLFSFLTMKDSNKLRGQCVECRDAIMAFEWMDPLSRITGNLKAWRAAFPLARVVNVSGRYNITDTDFVHIRGDARVRLHTVNIGRCRNLRITDAAFVHLRGIHTLDMSDCKQETITDAAFVHLRGIHTLSMQGCTQRTITDGAFAHLRGIHTLYMYGCNQETVTDAAFVYLSGIHTLNMSYCNQATITNLAFIHLSGIHTLVMSHCNQATITGVAFAQLHGIRVLRTEGCSLAVRAAAALVLYPAP
jgi:hypothetical protein